MDAQESIRQLMADILNHEGYQVEAVAVGAEAVERCRKAVEWKELFDAIILDLTVPSGMGGIAAAAEILKIDPTANLLVASGYSNDSVLSSYREYGFCAVVEKPYTLHKLASVLEWTVRSADDARAAEA